MRGADIEAELRRKLLELDSSLASKKQATQASQQATINVIVRKQRRLDEEHERQLAEIDQQRQQREAAIASSLKVCCVFRAVCWGERERE